MKKPKNVVVPLKAPRWIPGPGKFDEVLFDLCRKDDYRGLYRELVRRSIIREIKEDCTACDLSAISDPRCAGMKHTCGR